VRSSTARKPERIQGDGGENQALAREDSVDAGDADGKIPGSRCKVLRGAPWGGQERVPGMRLEGGIGDFDSTGGRGGTAIAQQTALQSEAMIASYFRDSRQLTENVAGWIFKR